MHASTSAQPAGFAVLISLIWCLMYVKYIEKTVSDCIWVLLFYMHASSSPQQGGYAVLFSVICIFMYVRWPAWWYLGLSWVQRVVMLSQGKVIAGFFLYRTTCIGLNMAVTILSACFCLPLQAGYVALLSLLWFSKYLSWPLWC